MVATSFMHCVVSLRTETCLDLQVIIELYTDVVGNFEATVAHKDNAKKQVVLVFAFLDPKAFRVTDIAPMQEYVYGGSEMRLSVRNLPPNTLVNEIEVTFGAVGTVAALNIEPSSDGDIIVLAIPRSVAAGAETVSVDVRNGAFVAQIDQHFKYLSAPPLAILRAVPSSAAIQGSRNVRVLLEVSQSKSGSSAHKIRESAPGGA